MNEHAIFNIGHRRLSTQRLLWTNDSPDEARAQLTVEIPSDAMKTCQLFRIIWSKAGDKVGDSSYSTVIINEVQTTCKLSSPDGISTVYNSSGTRGGANWYRNVTVVESGLKFGSCIRYSDAMDSEYYDSCVMPLYIYGIE